MSDSSHIVTFPVIECIMHQRLERTLDNYKQIQQEVTELRCALEMMESSLLYNMEQPPTDQD